MTARGDVVLGRGFGIEDDVEVRGAVVQKLTVIVVTALWERLNTKCQITEYDTPFVSSLLVTGPP